MSIMVKYGTYPIRNSALLREFHAYKYCIGGEFPQNLAWGFVLMCLHGGVLGATLGSKLTSIHSISALILTMEIISLYIHIDATRGYCFNSLVRYHVCATNTRR